MNVLKILVKIFILIIILIPITRGDEFDFPVFGVCLLNLMANMDFLSLLYFISFALLIYAVFFVSDKMKFRLLLIISFVGIILPIIRILFSRPNNLLILSGGIWLILFILFSIILIMLNSKIPTQKNH